MLSKLFQIPISSKVQKWYSNPYLLAQKHVLFLPNQKNPCPPPPIADSWRLLLQIFSTALPFRNKAPRILLYSILGFINLRNLPELQLQLEALAWAGKELGRARKHVTLSSRRGLRHCSLCFRLLQQPEYESLSYGWSRYQ